MFYETVELSAGLGARPAEMETIIAQESPEVQTTIKAVQAEALAPLLHQQALLESFCKFSVEAKNLSPLLQLFGMGIADSQINLAIQETNLSVVPFRSLNGITWLNEYCNTDFTLPGLEPNQSINKIIKKN
jgi:hypothetical protein